LRKSQKVQFEEAIVALKGEIPAFIKKMIERVQDAIDAAFVALRKELEIFLFQYRHEFFTPSLSEELDKNKIEVEVFRILREVKLPNAHELVEKLKVSIHYYDLTWEDLSADEMLDWFKSHDLFTDDVSRELATVRSAYEEKL
jgi:hypothetical protein